jgi:hypothetical protein
MVKFKKTTQLETKAENPLTLAKSAVLALFSYMFSRAGESQRNSNP